MLRRIYYKYNTMPVEAKASLWYIVCNILQKGISFIIIPIYTRVLTITEYGEYSVFNAWLNILVIFATLNLYCGVFTKAMVDYNNDRNRYISSMQGLSTSLTIVLFIVYIFNYKYWCRVLQMSTKTIMFMFIYFIFYPANAFWTVRQRVEYKYKKMVWITLLISVATPVFSIFLLYNTVLRTEAIIWGYLIVQSIAGAVFYFYNFSKNKTFYEKNYWMHGLKFNIPLIPHYLSLIILEQSDRIMIDNYCGPDKVAIYNLAYQASMIMSIFINSINNSFVPWVYTKLKQKNYSRIKKVSDRLCYVVAFLTICIILLAPELIKILGPRKYSNAVEIMPTILISVFLSFCYGLFSNVEFYFNATSGVMIASVIGAVLNIILNVVFIPLCGYQVAGYTTLCCYLVFMVMHYIFMRRICKREILGKQVYNIKNIVGSCIFVFFIGMICIIIYKYNWLRHSLVFAGFIMCILQRKRILEIIK